MSSSDRTILGRITKRGNRHLRTLFGEWMVADDLGSGRLVEVLSEWTPSYPGYCLYYPGRRHMAASLRALVDLTREAVFRNRAS
jgi:DNA-binding transcriptional LysR family regulator